MLVNKAENAHNLINRIRDSKFLIYDSETSGLDWKRNHIIGHVFTFSSSPKDTYYVPVRHAAGGNLEGCMGEENNEGWDGNKNWFEELVIPLLSRDELTIVFHHGAFDMKFLHRLGWKPYPKTRDTMIAAYLEDELRRSLSLYACCIDEGVTPKLGKELYEKISEFTGIPMGKRPSDMMGHLWKLPGDDKHVVDYSCGDGTSTHDLWKVLEKKLEKPYYTTETKEFSLKRVSEVEFDLMPVIHKMMTTGIKIDMEKFEEIWEETTNSYNEAKEKIGDLNVRSPRDMREYFEKHGVTNWPLTPTGKPSFREEWLLTSDPGIAIVTARKLRTRLDSFMGPMKEKHIIDGRLYPNFSQTRDEKYGTKTGRLSAHDPNLHAQPGKRQGELGKRFRECYVSDKEYWISADYMTCEIVVCTHYCKARVWVEGFKKGIKAHKAVADELDIPYQHAKTINLGLMTGMGKAALAADLGLPFEEASKVVNKYFRGLPELKIFQNKSTKAFRNRGFVSTLLGRRLRLEEDKFAYKALNRLTQGGNADIIKERMIAMDKVADEVGSRLILNVHDDISFEVDEKDQVSPMIECMKDMSGVELSIPMGVEWGNGRNWGEATFNEEGWK